MAKKIPSITDFNNIPEAALVPEDEQPYKIPAHWKWVRLGPFLDYAQRGKGPKYADSETGYLAISQKCVRWEGLDLTQARPWVPDSFEGLDDIRLLREQDLLWNSTGTGTIGRIVTVPPLREDLCRKLAADSHVTVMRTSGLLDSKYLLHFISSEHIQVQVEERLATGSTNQKELGLTAIKSLPIPLPPLEEQHQIVEYIEQAHAKIDNILQRLEQYIAEAPARRNELIQAGVSGVLTDSWREANGLLLEDWTSTKLEDLGDWGGGGTPRKSHAQYWEGGTLRWITPKDMKSDLITETLDRITELGAEESSARKYTGPAICIVTRSGILRRILPIGLVDGDFTVNQDMKVLLNISDGNITEYIFWFLVAREASIRNMCSKSGTTVESIDFGKLKGYPIKLPSSAEQEEIVRRIQTGNAKLEASVNLAQRALDDIRSLRNATLLAALSGRIDPRP